MSEESRIRLRTATPEEWPLCPYCKRQLKEIVHKERGWLTTTSAFWCPHCGCLLSIATTFNS